MEEHKLKVLQLIDVLKGGGMEEWVKDITRLVNPKRFEIKVGYLIDLRESGNFSYIEELKRLGADVYYLGLSRRFFKAKSINTRVGSRGMLRRSLRQLYLFYSLIHLPGLVKLIRDEEINIIHAHMHCSFILAALAGKICKIPVVYQVSETREQIVHFGRPTWILAAYRWLHPLVNTFLTGYTGDKVEELGIPHQKIREFRGSIDLDQIRSVPPGDNPVVSEFSLGEAFPLFLSVGRFTPEKGHRFAIETALKVREKLPKTKLIILGDGWEHEKIKTTVRQKGWEDFIILPGFRTDLWNFHSLAHIYLHTSLTESLNKSMLLAAAYRKPVIGFDLGKAEAKGILVVPKGDSQKMAEVAVMLAQDEELRRRLGEDGMFYVQGNWDIRKAITFFESEYIKLWRLTS